MRIVVIQGSDLESSRRRYSQIISSVRKKNWEVVEYSPDLLVSTSLFSSNVLYTIDGVKNVNPKDIEWLAKNDAKYEGNLLIYVEGNLPSSIKKVLPKSAQFETFDLPAILWQFIDSFYPGNSKRCLQLLELLLQKEPVELIIALLARKLRDYYRGSSGRFTKELLVVTIDSLAELDYKSKTSDVDTKLMLKLLIAEKLA